MPPISEEQIAELLDPYVAGLQLPDGLYAQVQTFVELLLRWNARTNLTAVRDPEQLVQRQVGESLFAARHIRANSSVLDFGSGAGFPGIPLQLLHPQAAVMLAESQGKKASFLREAVRVLGLHSKVWADRVEKLPTEQAFSVVTMRAVDQSSAMLRFAAERVDVGGALVLFVAGGDNSRPEGWQVMDDDAVPMSTGRLIRLQRPGMFHVEHGDARE